MKPKALLGFAMGPVATSLLGLVLLPALAWLFSPEDIGRNNLFQLSVAFCVTLLSLGLPESFLREYHETPTADRAKLFKAMVLPGLLFLPLLAILAGNFATELSQRLFGLSDPLPIYFLVMVACSTYVNRALALVVRMEERGWAFSFRQLLSRLLLLLALPLLCIRPERSFVQLAAVSVVAELGVVAWQCWTSRRLLGEVMATRVGWRDVRPLLVYGLPMLLSAALYWALSATGPLLMRGFDDFEQLGVYSIALSLSAVVRIATSIFLTVWAPTVHKWAAQGGDLARVDTVGRVALAATAILFSIVGALAWTAPLVLPRSYGVLQFLLVAAVGQPLLHALAQITCVGINMRRTTAYITLSLVVGLALNVILALALIPRFGAAGAVVSLMLGVYASLVIRTEIAARIWRDFPRRQLYLWTLALVAAASFSALFGEQLGPSVFLAWAAVGLLAACWFRADLYECVQAARSRYTRSARPAT